MNPTRYKSHSSLLRIIGEIIYISFYLAGQDGEQEAAPLAEAHFHGLHGAPAAPPVGGTVLAGTLMLALQKSGALKAMWAALLNRSGLRRTGLRGASDLNHIPTSRV